MKRVGVKLWLLGLALSFSAAVQSQDLSSIDISYKKYILDNGLTLLVHEDHSAPQAFVVVYYKVGSRDEKSGKTGFAHLFEHLMFNGSENHDQEYFNALNEVGGSANGDTWFDRTRYYQTVPSNALERILWLESDRMGHLLGVVTQEKLDQQRGVVQNEKRRGDNSPYGLLEYQRLAGLFPEGHPYRWSTIGSMADLNAASLEDVHSWFKQYYGAANTILVVGGNVDSDHVRSIVQHHFGDIPPGPPVTRLDDWVPERQTNTYEVMQDRAPNPMLSRSWVAPGRDHRQSSHLSIAARILGGDESSRLYKALVKDSGLAVNVSMHVSAHDLASMLTLSVVLKPDADPQLVRSIIEKQLQHFFKKGPERKELELVKTAISARTIKDLDSLRSRSVYLAESEFYFGDPEAYKSSFSWLDTATVKQVREVANQWLTKGYHEIFVRPFGEHSVAKQGADRSALPAVGDYPSAKAPAVSDHTLSNGLKVRFVKREGVPAVTVAATLKAGEALVTDTKAGVYQMTMSMLDKGTGRRSADDIEADLKRSGSRFSASPGADDTYFMLSTLSSKLDGAMELFADILRNPSFNEDELELLKEQTKSGITFEKSTPAALARRYLRWQVYGSGHPYGKRPVTEKDIAVLEARDLRAFHQRWFRPDQMTLVAVGGIDEKSLIASLEKRFGDWKAMGTPPLLAETKREPVPTKTKVILFDAPGAPQSNIVAAQQIPAPYGFDHESLQLANRIYGGAFTSRINMNIRENKGWSYGVRSSTGGDRGTRLWQISAQVQTDKTAASISELLEELRAISGKRPFSAEELAAVRNDMVRSLPATTATSDGVLYYFLDVLRHGHQDTFLEQRKSAYDAVSVSSMQEAMARHLDGDQLVWFVVGDIAKIEAEVRALNLGPVEIWSAEGKRLR